MKRYLFIKLFLVLFTLSTFSRVVHAQSSAVDQYRQMGGIVGLTEVCLKTNNLEIALFKQVGQVFFSQPQMGLTMTQLLTVYFESKEVAKAKKVIWNGSTQSYNKKALNCKNKAVVSPTYILYTERYNHRTLRFQKLQLVFPTMPFS